MEKHLDTDFDIITLIGVLEYAVNYIDSTEPYTDFLRQVRRHLKPGGRLIIAIENRTGMKYFAGATEDHSGVLFEGIEGYRGKGRARTFSRPELEKILTDSGLPIRTFYYPFPDYKLPMTIYSDEYLPKKGELRDNFCNFDRERMQLFDEPRVYDTLVDSGLFPEFSNSFLVLAERKE